MMTATAAATNCISETEKDELLKEITTFLVKADPSFRVRDKLCEGGTVDGVHIASIGENLKEFFLMKEERVPLSVCSVIRLEQESFDERITEKLPVCRETTFGHFWAALVKFGSGSDVRFRALMAYIYDVNGILRLVYAQWSEEALGWRLDAFSKLNASSRTAGRHFVSRRPPNSNL